MKKVIVLLLIICCAIFALGSTDPLYLNIMDYNAKADGSDDAPAFTAAIEDASLTRKPIFIPNGTYGISSVRLKSNVKFIGESNSGTIIKSLNQTDLTRRGTFCNDIDPITKYWEVGTLDNISFNNIKFDGNRINLTKENSAIFLMIWSPSHSVNNLTIDNCVFESFSGNGLRIDMAKYDLSPDLELQSSGNIKVLNSKFLGGPDHDHNGDMPGSAVRIGFFYSMPYGNYFMSNVLVANCYAEKIRTLADFKRGCQDFIITNCETKNMYDCHHSTDGSKDGVIKDCKGFTDLALGTGTNFVEIQGENIVASGLFFDGGNLSEKGLQITDHVTQSSENHLNTVSKDIIVDNCTFKNLTKFGIKFTNVQNSIISDCKLENVMGTTVSIESGTGANSSLTGNNISLFNNQFLNCQSGMVLMGENVTLGAGNIDENGNTLFRDGLTSLMLRKNIQFKNITSGDEINPNPDMLLNAGGDRIKYFETGDKINGYDTNDCPVGSKGSVTLVDTVEYSLGQVVFQQGVECKKYEAIHTRIFAKKADTNSVFSIVFNEYCGSTYLKTNFIGTTALSDYWQEFYCTFVPTNELTDWVSIQLIPATDYNYLGAKGKVKIASFNISKSPIGID